jgi:hypothetical protein
MKALQEMKAPKKPRASTMQRDSVLAILAGKVLDVSVNAITVQPGTRIELPLGHDIRVSVGALVLGRALHVRGRYVAQSIVVEQDAD